MTLVGPLLVCAVLSQALPAGARPPPADAPLAGPPRARLAELDVQLERTRTQKQVGVDVAGVGLAGLGVSAAVVVLYNAGVQFVAGPMAYLMTMVLLAPLYALTGSQAPPYEPPPLEVPEPIVVTFAVSGALVLAGLAVAAPAAAQEPDLQKERRHLLEPR